MAEKKLHRVQRIRGSQTATDNFTGMDGELTINRDSHSIRVHDNKTPGGFGTVNADYLEEAYEGMDAPQDYPVGAHIIAGPGRIDGSPVQAMPLGSIAWFGVKTAPKGWLICDGSAVSRETYAGLFAFIGTTFGAGDGSKTFNLPNLIGKFAEGGLNVGLAKEAGLPNFTAKLTQQGNRAGIAAASGAVTISGGTRYAAVGEGGSLPVDITIDPSKQKPIYGKSETVQPASLTLLPCIKAYDGYMEINDLSTENLAAEIVALDKRLGNMRIVEGNITIYVRTNGSDDYDGRTPESAFKTITRAVYEVGSFIMHNGIATIDIGAGTFDYDGVLNLPRVLSSGGVTSGCIMKGAGKGQTILRSLGDSDVLNAGLSCYWSIYDFTLRNVGSGRGVICQAHANLNMENIAIDGNITGHHILVFGHGRVYCPGGLDLRSSAAFNQFIYVVGNAYMRLFGNNVFIGNVGAGQTVYSHENSSFDANGATFTGSSVTGVRYLASGSSTIFTNGGGANFLPGSAAGIVANGGVYY